MPCTQVKLPGGGFAIVCGRTGADKRCACRNIATRLCDWKLAGKTTRGPNRPPPTCDAPLCAECTHVPAPGKDLCPEHAAQWQARQQTQPTEGEPA